MIRIILNEWSTARSYTSIHSKLPLKKSSFIILSDAALLKSTQPRTAIIGRCLSKRKNPSGKARLHLPSR